MPRKKSPSSKAELGLPAEAKIVPQKNIIKITSGGKAPKKKVKRAAKKLSSAKITDELLLNRVRDSVYEKLKSGELSPSLTDGFKAIDLKHKITTDEPDDRLLILFEELRKELLRKE